MANNDTHTSQNGDRGIVLEKNGSVIHEESDAALSHGQEWDNRTERRPIISVRNLTRVYHVGQNQIHALQGVSLQVYSGEFVAIMGPSGSGKSTFMNLIGCLDRPSSGDYWLAGVPVGRMSVNRLADIRNQLIGFVFQGFNLLSRATAMRNVDLPLMYAGLQRKEQERKGRMMLRLLGLKARMYHKPSELSGGQQQRVAIARALVNDPSILLADEPTGNLDSQTSAEIMATLQALNDLGLTILLVTHDPEVAAYAKRQIIFHDGRILCDEIVADRRSSADFWSLSENATDTSQHQEKKEEVSPGTLTAMSAITQYSEEPRRRSSLIVSNVGSAIVALWANRLRSLLTMLGIVIGVGAVIAAVTLTLGTSALLNQNLSNLGTNILNISPDGPSSKLTVADANAISQVSHVAHVSPVLLLNGQIIYGNQHTSAQVQGVNADYESIGSWNVAEGAWFSSDDNQAALPVAVIGKTIADNLFAASGVDPINQKLFISGQVFRIVGVLQAKGAQGGTNQDNVVFVTFTFAATHLKSSSTVDQIQVQVDSADNVADVQQSITSLLEDRHHLSAVGTSHASSVGQPATGGVAGGPAPIGGSSSSSDDFMILNANQLLQTLQQQGQAQATLLIGIAAISLTVGGIGVMNIMLVSVMERTREIGIRMAVGARRRYIRDQFLIEALTLCSLGGLIGILLGLLGGLVLIHFSSQQLPFVLSPLYMLLAFGVSVVVGIVFGLYPAIRASQLDPIVALRME